MRVPFHINSADVNSVALLREPVSFKITNREEGRRGFFASNYVHVAVGDAAICSQLVRAWSTGAGRRFGAELSRSATVSSSRAAGI